MRRAFDEVLVTDDVLVNDIGLPRCELASFRANELASLGSNAYQSFRDNKLAFWRTHGYFPHEAAELGMGAEDGVEPWGTVDLLCGVFDGAVISSTVSWNGVVSPPADLVAPPTTPPRQADFPGPARLPCAAGAPRACGCS